MNNLETQKDSIGIYLKSEREKRNLSIKIISQYTKISPSMLEHLESDKHECLPNITYCKGYVKSYAKILNLDLNHCLKLFGQTYGEQIGPTHLEKNLQQKNTHTKNVFWATCGALIIGFIIFFNIVQKRTPKTSPETASNSPETLEVTSNPKHLLTTNHTADDDAPTPITASPTSVPILELAHAPVIEPVATPVDVAADIPTNNKQAIPKFPSEETINLKAITGPLFKIDNTTHFSDVAQYLPEESRNAVVKNKQNVFINAFNGDTWITYKTDNNPIKRFVLKRGKTIMIRGEVVRIFLGNVHTTKIFLNNQLLELESKSGVKSLIFPAELSKNFKLPLFIYPSNGEVIPSDEYEKNLQDI